MRRHAGAIELDKHDRVTTAYLSALLDPLAGRRRVPRRDTQADAPRPRFVKSRATDTKVSTDTIVQSIRLYESGVIASGFAYRMRFD